METLRLSGIRIEELLEISQLSIRQYRRPGGEVVALLIIAPSKTDRERVIPMSAELFTVIGAIIRRHTRDGGAVPVVTRYDPHERETLPPLPYLFQRPGHAGPAVITAGTVVRAPQRDLGPARRCPSSVRPLAICPIGYLSPGMAGAPHALHHSERGAS